LGFVTYPKHRLLKRRNGVAFQRRFKAQLRALEAGQLELDRLKASLRGWIAHAAHGQTYGLRRALIGRQLIPAGPARPQPAPEGLADLFLIGAT
jgi:hypothetical protein